MDEKSSVSYTSFFMQKCYVQEVASSTALEIPRTEVAYLVGEIPVCNLNCLEKC